ncbi:hypothetical protein M231_02686 [Tremella mesenterica]|uniref:Uncharacterized protein n=1 Tax=Tremella mesenterica TaxID=5217 RepID=A0A4Q1BQ60_TREME|nr:hypothetical protein M231_02686 [Tremella mesenterica]
MSLQDRLSTLEPKPLLNAAAGLSLVIAASTQGYSYNFALSLFGIIAYELNTVGPLRQFVILTLSSLFLDLYTLFHLNGLIFFLTFCISGLKVFIGFSSLAQLKERGGDINVGSFGVGGLPSFASSRPEWSQPMPGGFTDSSPAVPPPSGEPVQPQFPSGEFKLGGEEETPTGRGGYQTIA